ncbi:MAG: orotidine-5'-phosphate decarboxylase [Polyangiaceae bacterium]|nr:orotidine-5'-phosphate decarboxylase [Polyangiaceae bacterium]
MTPLLAARSRLAFALDYPSLEAAREGASRVAAHVGVLKIGLELFVREGPRAIELGAELGCDIFLDLKLHDIPATVERSVRAAASHRVRYLTVHAVGGRGMLEAAVRAAEGSPLTLLAVTVLTSLDATDLEAMGVGDPPATQALRLARLARGAGMPGLVCSAAEVSLLRNALDPATILVTPGIRPNGPHDDDQKRVATPARAVRDGASLLVVGRPIRDAADPAAAAEAIVAEIAGAANGPS